ncbi:hypothetical protein LC607_03735 [Nostoc sp. CHAB 5824]|nr:hypothetical protein [Nostoc sp. CHAB 5824]
MRTKVPPRPCDSLKNVCMRRSLLGQRRDLCVWKNDQEVAGEISPIGHCD